MAPVAIVALVTVHLILLHNSGSSNPTGTRTNHDKIRFFPYFLVKDTTPTLLVVILMRVLISIEPDIMGDPENFNLARITTTPTHIKPE
jgi:quinol-cytochrome oxidoreductase complex cytochrome b subunit